MENCDIGLLVGEINKQFTEVYSNVMVYYGGDQILYLGPGNLQTITYLNGPVVQKWTALLISFAKCVKSL